VINRYRDTANRRNRVNIYIYMYVGITRREDRVKGLGVNPKQDRVRVNQNGNTTAMQMMPLTAATSFEHRGLRAS